MAPGNFRGRFFAIIKCVEIAGIGLFSNIRGVRKNHKSQIMCLTSRRFEASEAPTANHQAPVTHRQLPVTNYPSPQPALPMIQLVEINFAAERIAVNAKQPCGARLVAVETVQHALDEFLFKFVDCFVELDPPLHHQANQRFQLLLHRSTLRTRVVGRRTIPAARLTEFVAR
jgi:hypothetical protein